MGLCEMTRSHDRNYWRCAPLTVLQEAARDSGSELGIAIGERLEEIADQEAHITKLLDAMGDILGWLRDELDPDNDEPGLTDTGMTEARKLCEKYWALAEMPGRAP